MEETLQKIDLGEYIENLLETIPKDLQTPEIKTKIVNQVNDIVISVVADYMPSQDAADMVKMAQNMDIPGENILKTYIETHSFIGEILLSELDYYAQIFQEFYKI